MDEELRKKINQKDILYTEIKTQRKEINDLVEQIGEARGIFNKLVHKFNKLDRKIFEKTVGITKIGKNPETSKKKIPMTLEELTSAERETLLAQLLAIQARRQRC